MTTDLAEAPATVDQAAEEAAFMQAAAQATGTPVETPNEPTPPETPVETPKAEAAPAPVVEDLPSDVKLTKAQVADLMDVLGMKGDLAKAIAMRGKLEEGFGTLGELKQTLKQMQGGGGADVTIDDVKDFAELHAAEYPQMAKMLGQGLSRILGRIKAGGTPAQMKQDLGALKDELVTAAEHRARNAACQEYLDDEHEGWQDLVGRVTIDANGQAVMPDTEFRRWAATTYDKAKHDRIFASKNGPMLAKVIERFKNEKAKAAEPPKPDPKAVERKERVAAAVQPTGLPATGTPEKTEQDEFTAAANATLKARGLA